LLRPGGLALFIEPSPIPIADGRPSTDYGDASHTLHGWFTFWETYRACLRTRGIDETVPGRIHDLLIESGSFERVVAQDISIPVGFWPTGKFLLSGYTYDTLFD
jgi:hypothetical protein